MSRRSRAASGTGGIPERARAAFPILRGLRYFDTASRAPLATPVREALEAFLDQRQGEHRDKAEWTGVVERARRRFAERIGASPDEVALTKNTSEGLNAIAHSIPWRSGDSVVVADTEHPNNLYPWLHLERRYGVRARRARCEGGVVTVDRIAERIDARTRAVAVSAVSFMPGGRADLPGLSAVCRERGVALVVDGIQALGILRIHVGRDGVDALATGGHKGLLGPYGVGFLYCRGGLASEWTPAYIARSGVAPGAGPYSFVEDPSYELVPTAARYEIGNPNYEGLHGLDGALGFLEGFDPEAVERHVLDLSGRLCEGLRERGVVPLNPEADGARSGIVSFRPPDAPGLRRELAARGVAVALKGDCLRASFHLFNTLEEVESLLEDLGELLRS